MIQVDLPDLEESFKQQLITLSKDVATNKDAIQRWLQHCIKLDRKDVVQDEYIYLDDYQSYLDNIFAERVGDKLTYYLIVLKNVLGETSIYPKHQDDVRLSGINYYLELGGDDVITNFYLPDKVSFKAEKNKWYIFNACKEHEVLNISSTRIVLGMDLESQPSYEDLKRRLL